MSEWIEWKGGEQPVRGDTLVMYSCRQFPDCFGFDFAKSLHWNVTGAPHDIMEYKICATHEELEELFR